VGARDGHFPTMIALINYDRFTPVPALVVGVRDPTPFFSVQHVFFHKTCVTLDESQWLEWKLEDGEL